MNKDLFEKLKRLMNEFYELSAKEFKRAENSKNEGLDVYQHFACLGRGDAYNDSAERLFNLLMECKF